MKIKGLLNTNLPCLNFDDVLIEPRVSEVYPEEADISTTMMVGLKSNLPIISAHMSTVSSPELIAAVAEMGGLGTLHEDIKLEEIDEYIAKIKHFKIDEEKYPKATTTDSGTPFIIAACSAFDLKKAEYLLGHDDVHYVILNNVQPLHVQIIKNVRELSRKYPYKIILGNIANREGAEIYASMPLAALKIGLGPGSICTTGIISGCGMSQLTSILEVYQVTKEKKMKIIADGGIRNSGDIVKALAAGADGVMLGRLFAGCDEAPGKTVEINGKKYKQYEGSQYNTVEIPDKTGFEKIDAFLTSGVKNSHRVEGMSGLVPSTGPAHLLLYILSRNLQVALGFIGARNIKELRAKSVFRYVSPNSFKDLRPNLELHITEPFI